MSKIILYLTGRAKTFHGWARRLAVWASDVVPLVPRYWWVYEAHAKGLDSMKEAFRRRHRTAIDLGSAMYQPDLMISWGDFLKVQGLDNAATDRYEEARKVARKHGFGLVRRSAEARLAGNWVVPKGLRDIRF